MFNKNKDEQKHKTTYFGTQPPRCLDPRGEQIARSTSQPIQHGFRRRRNLYDGLHGREGE